MLNKERHRKQPLIVGKQSGSLKFKSNIIKKNNAYGYEAMRALEALLKKITKMSNIRK